MFRIVDKSGNVIDYTPIFKDLLTALAYIEKTWGFNSANGVKEV